MKLLSSALLSLIVCHAYGQEYDQHLSYLNRKTVALGYARMGMSVSGLNEVLQAAGYPVVPNSINALTLHVGTDFGPHWGMFYGTDIGLMESREIDSRSLHFQYNRFYLGAEYTLLRGKHAELLGRLAFSYNTAQLRLYDTLQDTPSFVRYLSGKNDAKRVQTDGAGIELGLQARILIPKNTLMSFLGFKAGYILAIGGNDWNHDGWRFDEAPYTWLGSWYAGVHIGGLYHRRITRIPAAEFKPR